MFGKEENIMNKTELTLTMEAEKMEALNFWLRKENTTAQKKMNEALAMQYEQTVPEAVREYLDRRSAPVRDRPRRPSKSAGKARTDGSQNDSTFQPEMA